MLSRPTVILALVAIVAAVSSACGDDDDGSSPEKLKVITTVSPITSIVENIGGTAIDLEGVIPEGVNSHTFEPPPSVVGSIEDADLIILNGLKLEEPTLKLAESDKRVEGIVDAVIGRNGDLGRERRFEHRRRGGHRLRGVTRHASHAHHQSDGNLNANGASHRWRFQEVPRSGPSGAPSFPGRRAAPGSPPRTNRDHRTTRDRTPRPPPWRSARRTAPRTVAPTRRRRGARSPSRPRRYR